MSASTSRVSGAGGSMNREEILSLDLCVRCNSCGALCPTYDEAVVEGMNARGRVFLLKKFTDGELTASDGLDRRIFSCMLCGACNTLCPRGLNITDAIYEGRRNLRKLTKKRRLLEGAVAYSFRRADSAFRLFRLFRNVINRLPLRKYPLVRALDAMVPDLPRETLRRDPFIFKVPKPKARIALFAGCTVNFLYPHMGDALIRSLNAINYDVILPKGEICCGAPLLGLGLEDDTVEFAKKNVATFRDLKVEAVISLCPTCTHFISDEYKRLMGSGIENAVDISQFLHDKGTPLTSTDDGKAGIKRIIYHDPCHSRHYLKISREPRQILKALGFEVLEPKDRGCCGFAGAFKVLYEDLSDAILNRRIEDYRKADMIVTSCPNCVLQFKSKIKDKPVKHIIEVIEKGITHSLEGERVSPVKFFNR